ncbi:MAG: serine/threonine-protein phosphatase [Candidatus Aminicenantes bacterium]|nr:serine/threonine-protein phosphatase [Candidatus Aminicenantes bacterium]
MSRIKTETFLYTAKGRRKRNEDFIGKSVFKIKEKNVVLMAVADGMGGYEGGNLASKKAVNLFLMKMKKYFKNINSIEDVKFFIRKTYRQINDEIYEDSKTDERLQDMGTTLTALVIVNDQYIISNVGDSRAYVLKTEDIQQVTEDHSAVAESLKEGRISPLEIKKMPFQHALTRNLGNDHEVEVDIFPNEGAYRTNAGTAVILMTDGITSVLSELEVYDRIVAGKSLKSAAEDIVSYAYQKGSSDNMSIALAEIGKMRRKNFSKVKKTAFAAKKQPKKPGGIVLKSLVFLTFSILLLILVILFLQKMLS